MKGAFFEARARLSLQRPLLTMRMGTTTPSSPFARHGGATQLEIGCIAFSLLLLSALHYWFTTRVNFLNFYGGRIALFFIEFVLLAIVPILMHTYTSDHLELTVGVLMLACIILYRLPITIKYRRLSIFQDFKILLLVCTVVVIAAVDIRRYPGRFTKRRTYGWSPMDLGTGLFAAIHAHSLLRRDEQHRARNKNAQTQDLPSARISQIVLLAAIGLLRVGFIAISGYAQDIAEYGEHWNFFLTLAAMQIFVLVARRIAPRRRLFTPILALLIGAVYTCILLVTPLEQYLLGLERYRIGGIFDSNREGICSIGGYLLLFGVSYLVAYCFTPHFLWTDKANNLSREQLRRVLFKLTRNVVVQGALYAAALHFFGDPSRRVANLVYVAEIHTIVTFNTLVFFTYQRFLSHEPTISFHAQSPFTLMHTSISRHAEYFFIVANLLTGLLNYARSPLLYTPNREFAALIAYMFVLCLGAQIYDRYFSSRRLVKAR